MWTLNIFLRKNNQSKSFGFLKRIYNPKKALYPRRFEPIVWVYKYTEDDFLLTDKGMYPILQQSPNAPTYK